MLKPTDAIKRMLPMLAELHEESDAGTVKLILRDKDDKPIAACIYVQTESADIQILLDAVESIEDSWNKN